MKVIDVPIEKIHLGERCRQDMGNIEALASNIREMGLLQPIGVDEYFNLIYGARRLEACDNLGWKHMPCVVVKLKSLLAGEYAENEFRKQFTKSERAAIGKALEADDDYKKQQGKRTDKLPEKIPEVSKEMRQKIATAAGFGNETTMRQAQTVIDKGVAELKAAMDSGDLSTSAAAMIASQPKDDQKRIVKMPKDERRTVIRQIRKTKADQEADDRRARDIYLFRGIHNAVEFIAQFPESPEALWPGISRVSAWTFAENLDRALDFLTRARKAHPNALRKPQAVV